MDGLEWKRSKYSKPVRLFLRFAERLAVKYSHYHVADSIGIQQYLKLKYNIESTYLPYGSFVFENYDQKIIEDYKLKPFAYNILVARMEPENHIEEIIEAHILSETDKPLVLVGNYLKTKFGRYLFEKYKNRTNILFLGGIYDQFRLNNLRYFSNLYFHGHSVGGTNPSLLEAMGSNCLICAHNNPFNQTILGSEAFYFKGSNDLADIIKNKQKLMHPELIMLNTEKIKVLYSWEKIVSDYEKYFHFILKNKG
jgi:glycosyltransferase involved in cell wall biosynthesis